MLRRLSRAVSLSHSQQGADDELNVRGSVGTAASIFDTAKKWKVKISDVAKLLEDHAKREKKLRDLVTYVVFIVIFLVGLFMLRDVPTAYLLEETYENMFVYEEFPPEFSSVYKDYTTIRNIDEFWQWCLGPLSAAVVEAANNGGYAKEYNKFIGKIRFRQVRVKKGSCDLYSKYDRLFDSCYDRYTSSDKDETPYGPNGKYIYRSSDELRSTGDVGRLVSNALYGGGGFAVEMPVDTNFTQAIQEMIDDVWIDKQTRAIFITMNLLNANLNHFSFLKFVVELPQSGGISSWFKFMSYRIHLYLTPYDHFGAFLQVCVILFVVYFIYMEINEVLETKRETKSVKGYFMNPWNILDMLNLFIFSAVILMFIGYLSDSRRLNADIETTEYFGMDYIAQFYTTIFDINSFNILLSFFKVFKFMEMNPRLSMMWNTLGHAAPDLLTFLFFFSIIFVGFVTMGHLLFGPDIYAWRDYLGSISVCSQMIIGIIDYQGLHNVHRFFGPTFYIAFLILVYFTLANIFLAILNDAYAKVRSDASDSAHLTEAIRKGIQKKWKQIMRKIRKDNTMTFEEMLDVIKQNIKPEEDITVERIKTILKHKVSETRAEELYHELVSKAHKSNTNLLKSTSTKSIDHSHSKVAMEAGLGVSTAMSETQYDAPKDDEDESKDIDHVLVHLDDLSIRLQQIVNKMVATPKERHQSVYANPSVVESPTNTRRASVYSAQVRVTKRSNENQQDSSDSEEE